MFSFRHCSLLQVLPFLFSVWSAVGVVLLVGNWQTPLGSWGDFVFLALGAAVLAQTVALWLGFSRMLILLTWVLVVSGLAEAVGAVTGWPFGTYRYTGNMGPLLGDLLPAAIPLAWWVVVVPLWCLVRRWAVGWPGYLVVILASLLAVWTDVLLEPLATTGRQYWIWQDGGSYYGVPERNFAGWLVVSLLILSGVEYLLRWWGVSSLSRRALAYILFPYFVTIGVFCLSTWVQVRQGYFPGTIGLVLLLFLAYLYRQCAKRSGARYR